MFDVVLFQPEIPPNTGNVMRLCASTGVRLHLIEPLGFALDDRQLRRAGLDYHEWAKVKVHADFGSFMTQVRPPRLFAFSTKGHYVYTALDYKAGDTFLFGPETRGLPAELLEGLPPGQRLRLPMLAEVRSLNLSNAVAVVVYEAWRQLGFDGGT